MSRVHIPGVCSVHAAGAGDRGPQGRPAGAGRAGGADELQPRARRGAGSRDRGVRRAHRLPGRIGLPVGRRARASGCARRQRRLPPVGRPLRAGGRRGPDRLDGRDAAGGDHHRPSAGRPPLPARARPERRAVPVGGHGARGRAQRPAARGAHPAHPRAPRVHRPGRHAAPRDRGPGCRGRRERAAAPARAAQRRGIPAAGGAVAPADVRVEHRADAAAAGDDHPRAAGRRPGRGAAAGRVPRTAGRRDLGGDRRAAHGADPGGGGRGRSCWAAGRCRSTWAASPTCR